MLREKVEASAETVPTFADLLDHLLRTRLNGEGRPYTYREIVRATEGRVGYNHLKRLHSGLIRQPRWTTIRALALFFRVDIAYFFPELRGEDLERVEYGEGV